MAPEEARPRAPVDGGPRSTPPLSSLARRARPRPGTSPSTSSSRTTASCSFRTRSVACCGTRSFAGARRFAAVCRGRSPDRRGRARADARDPHDKDPAQRRVRPVRRALRPWQATTQERRRGAPQRARRRQGDRDRLGGGPTSGCDSRRRSGRLAQRPARAHVVRACARRRPVLRRPWLRAARTESDPRSLRGRGGDPWATSSALQRPKGTSTTRSGQFIAHHLRSLGAGASRGDFSEAILEHGFAMHFFQDAFAAGHLVMTSEGWRIGNPARGDATTTTTPKASRSGGRWPPSRAPRWAQVPLELSGLDPLLGDDRRRLPRHLSRRVRPPARRGAPRPRWSSSSRSRSTRVGSSPRRRCSASASRSRWASSSNRCRGGRSTRRSAAGSTRAPLAR